MLTEAVHTSFVPMLESSASATGPDTNTSAAMKSLPGPLLVSVSVKYDIHGRNTVTELVRRKGACGGRGIESC